MRAMKFTFPRSTAETRVRFFDSVEDIPLKADMMIADARVSELYRNELPMGVHSLDISGGEGCKTPETLCAIWAEMARAGLRRDSTVAVTGGGTLCDVGAFAASTWKRGLNLILVPTTLLCMVDAALGGKTAVNAGREKNQAGTIYPASEILVCPGFLDTLPETEVLSGAAEALKTAVIGDRAIVDHLQERNWIEVVKGCMTVKGAIVSRDLEETGERRLLNLGHTVGHCLEGASGYAIPHGIAVAMGIPVAARMGGHHDFAREFTERAAGLGIDTAIPREITLEAALAFLPADKKSTERGRTWIIPRGWENCVQVVLSPEEEKELLRRSWR